jgi:hypothetical protein
VREIRLDLLDDTSVLSAADVAQRPSAGWMCW